MENYFNLNSIKIEIISIDSLVHIRSFFFSYEQEYLVYGYFQQRWEDPRLAGKLNYTLILKGGDIQNMWLPDPYCYNARESNMMIQDNQLHSKISVDPSGKIFYSRG